MSEHVALGAPSLPPERAEGSLALLERIGKDLSRVESTAAFVALAWPVPSVPSERLLGAERVGTAVLWAPPGDDEVCGLGAAFTINAQGADRFQSIQDQARAAWLELDASRCEGALAPRFLGGFAFQIGQAEHGLWQGFGDACFVLPQISYVKSKGGAWLRLIVPSSGWDRAAFRARLETPLTRALQALFTPSPAHEAARELGRDERSPEAWGELVAAIQGELKSGRAQKIVAARRIGLRLDRELLPEVVQARLREDAPESTRFAFRLGAATFLGATPEQLVQKRGLELHTEAVAGSVSADDASAVQHLLESDKDSREHDFVVREILRVLEPITSELEPAPRREVHRLRTVLHLRTPISATLREAAHVLELVGKLHPTPAVGGVPTSAALDFITQHEPDERGWYTGPVGWFDAAGDGRFVVALRSGVVCGDRVDLYAGAGVVQDSNATSEFAETRWKLAALLGALGISA